MPRRKTVALNPKLPTAELAYWSNVCISVSQVLFGIAAATFFVGNFDLSRVFVIALSLILAIIVWFLGWGILKW